MAHTPFSGTIPDERLYCPRHDMWVQEAANGEVLIGATSFGIFLAGEIIENIEEKISKNLLANLR